MNNPYTKTYHIVAVENPRVTQNKRFLSAARLCTLLDELLPPATYLPPFTTPARACPWFAPREKDGCARSMVKRLRLNLTANE